MRRPTQILSPSKGFQTRPPSVGPMTRLLVTGGAGFIGSNFTRRAVGQGHDVVVLDKLTYAGNKENLRDLLDAKKIEFVKGDVCDRGLVDRLVKQADAVVHFAAETHVDRSILEAGDFVQADVVGTFSVIAASREGEVFNIGASAEHSVNEIAAAILKALEKPKSLIRMVPDRPGHVQRHAVDAGKIRSRLGWTPSRPFAESLRETVRWYREHQAWWKAIKAGEFRDYHAVQYGG